MTVITFFVQLSRDLSPRHLYRIDLRPSFWPSAIRKNAHGNPAGIIAVRKSTKRSNKSNRLSNREMSVTLEQLTRRSRGGCPSFQHYSHATAPPQPVSDTLSKLTPQMATASCTLAQSDKRTPQDQNRATPPPPKKRLRLSLNKERSSTPHSSGCTSPCGSVTSNSSSQLPTSCSSTPPLSPNSTTSVESSLSHRRSRRKQYTPVRKIRSPDSVSGKHEHFHPMAEGEVHFTPQPCTSETTPPLEQTTPPHVKFTPPVDECTTSKFQSPQHSERWLSKHIEQPSNFCDISLWGGGRLAYSCDLSHCRQFDKFSQGHLENYAELVSKEGDIENYLYTVERLVNQGFFFPTSKLSEVFRVMWKCPNDHAIKKLHFYLQQDISLRSDTSMKSSHFWFKLRQCLNALTSNTQVLVASVQLSYLLSFLIKNLEANKHDPRSSLVEQLLSSKNMSNISAIIEVIFSLQAGHVDSATSLPTHAPVDCLLAMICLPLLTSNPFTHPELRTKLAREFAMKLDGLSSHTAQYQLISAIPSNYLKEKVLDFVLERNFVCDQSGAVAQAFASNVVSFGKITQLHLHRLPRHPNGSPQSLSFLLQLLTALIQTHLMTVSGSQPLVSLLPSSPSLSDQFMVNISRSSQFMDESQVRDELLEMHSSVLRFTDKLSQDNQYFIELTEPTTWFQLQLLSLITSAL